MSKCEKCGEPLDRYGLCPTDRETLASSYERDPTPQETQEWLNEIWSSDPDLWEYLMLYEDDEPAKLDALEEGLYMIESAHQVESKDLPRALDTLAANGYTFPIHRDEHPRFPWHFSPLGAHDERI